MPSAILKLTEAPSPNAIHLAHPKYRADIDGLRAVAVISVLLFHAMPKDFRGGFVGVDIFFVISGFLISSIIYGSLEAGSFSFREFYVRRIKRIFPALLSVLCASFAFGWFVLLPTEFAQLGKHIAGGAGFASNFVLWGESGYFDTAAAAKPLLHLWSLGIEEQFYILWPVILWGAWKKRLNPLSITLFVGFISFWVSLIWTKSSSVSAFYLPITRIWELLIGATLAWTSYYKPAVLAKLSTTVDYYLSKIVYVSAPEKSGHALSQVLSLCGFTLIIVALSTITEKSQFPGWNAVLPTLGAACCIAAGAQAFFNRKLLSNRVLVWFGLISFPLYLWHWPMLSFAHILEDGDPSLTVRFACLVLSIGLAWLTYRLLEKPIRQNRHNVTKTTVLIVLMLVIGYIGYNSFSRKGLEFRLSRFQTVTQKVTNAQSNWDFPGRLVKVELNGATVLSQASDLQDATLFVGDSNLEQYYPRIDELIKTKPTKTNSALFLSEGGCLPMPDTTSKPSEFCKTMMAHALKLALENPNIKQVVIAAQWYGYLYVNVQGARFEKNGENLEIGLGSPGYDKAMNSLSEWIRTLVANKKEVTLVLNIPIGQQLDPAHIAKRDITKFPHVFEFRGSGIDLNAFEKQFEKIKNDLIRVAVQNKIRVIDPVQFLCKNGQCASAMEDGEPKFKDMGHLRAWYVRHHVSFIDATVIQ